MSALKPYRWILIAILAVIPGMILGVLARVVHLQLPPLGTAAIFFVAILAAAFLIAWTAEATQSRVKSSLVVILVALIAVLPEYAVDMVFTGKAGYNLAEYGSYPMANMTGANRLLIGWGWPLVYFIAWMKTRQKYITLQKSQAVEISVLTLATAYAFFIWWRGELSLVDTAVLVGLFVGYLVVSIRIPTTIPEPEHGPPHALIVLSRNKRWWVLAGFFVFSALAIVAAAEPFAENLVRSGKTFGIDEFILVQWLAPLASEAPEVTIAAIFAFALLANYGLGMLISSKINQWTLLVGTIPLAFAVSHLIFHGSIAPLPLDARQSEELFLTAAQSLFAIMLLANLRFSWLDAGLLFILFTAQLALPSSEIRHIFSIAYLIGAGVIFARNPGRIVTLAKTAWEVARNPRKN